MWPSFQGRSLLSQASISAPCRDSSSATSFPGTAAHVPSARVLRWDFSTSRRRGGGRGRGLVHRRILLATPFCRRTGGDLSHTTDDRSQDRRQDYQGSPIARTEVCRSDVTEPFTEAVLTQFGRHGPKLSRPLRRLPAKTHPHHLLMVVHTHPGAQRPERPLLPWRVE